MPEKRWPLNFSGGKVRGTLRTVLTDATSPTYRDFLAQYLPEGQAAPQAADIGLRQRDAVLAETEVAAGRLHSS